MVRKTYKKPEIDAGIIDSRILLGSAEQKQVTVNHQSTNNIKGV